MRLTQDSSSAVQLIRAYQPGEIRINDAVYRDTVIIGARSVVTLPEVRTMDELGAIDVSAIFALEPELVLLGTGRHQVFPAAAFRARFLSAGIGFEAMDTGAACRTFNVLVGEQRRVAALLLV